MHRRVKFLSYCLMAAATASASCDDAVSNPPQALVSLALNTDSAGTGRCVAVGSDSLPTEDGQVVFVASRTRTEDLENLPRLTDGRDGASVECTVTETSPGTAYTISATFNGTTAATGAGRAFSISNATVVDGLGSNAFISWNSPSLAAAMSSSVCELSVDESVEGGGAIKITFSCPQFSNPSQPDIACQADGTFLLERCDT